MAQVPLDETFYHDPHLAQHWRSYFANDQVWVYHYFAASPFFDRSSNNGVIFTQAENNANTSQIVWSRQRFEDALRSLSGTEYMVAAGPPPSQYQGPDSGVWVVRKQNRRKRRSADGRTELPDEVTLLKTYYMCVERIYQAPAVGDIIGSKLLSATTELSRFFSVAQSLPIFTPAQGYRYLPPPKKSSATAPNAHGLQSARESRHGTPLPHSSLPPSSQTQLQQLPGPKTASSAPSNTLQDARSLLESFNLSLRYNGEYMDSNPLVGEPGSFKLHLTTEQLYAQQAAEQARAQAAKERQAQTTSSSAAVSAAPTPDADKTADTKALLLLRKGAKDKEKNGAGAAVPRVKRRKSKAANSPTAPATPVAATPT